MPAAVKTGGAAPTSPRFSRRKKLLFSTIALLLALAILESVSRLVIKATPNVRWQYHSNLIDALGFPELNEILEPDPELFWRVTPNLDHAHLTGKIADSTTLRFSVSTDAQGLRRVPAQQAARHTVLFLGDSCTFGVGVDDDQAFPALVQRQVEGLRCINAGVPGYSSFQGRRLLERLELPAPPDVVVITFGFNDAANWDNLGDIEHEARRLAADSGLVNQFKFTCLLRRALKTGRAKPVSPRRPKRPRLSDKEYAEEIRSIIRWCYESGGQPVLLMWPYRSQMHQPIAFSKQVVLQRIAETDHVKIINLIPTFRNHGGSALMLDVIHANERGCQLVAQTLIPVVAELIASGPDPGKPGPG